MTTIRDVMNDLDGSAREAYNRGSNPAEAFLNPIPPEIPYLDLEEMGGERAHAMLTVAASMGVAPANIPLGIVSAVKGSWQEGFVVGFLFRDALVCDRHGNLQGQCSDCEVMP